MDPRSACISCSSCTRPPSSVLQREIEYLLLKDVRLCAQLVIRIGHNVHSHGLPCAGGLKPPGTPGTHLGEKGQAFRPRDGDDVVMVRIEFASRALFLYLPRGQGAVSTVCLHVNVYF